MISFRNKIKLISIKSESHFLKVIICSVHERQILLNLIEHHIPKFTRLNKKQKLEIILRGINIDDDEYISLNTTLTKAVQNYILSTKRFAVMENID